MTTFESDFIVFYSWQTDLPQETNKKAIRTALRTAFSKIEMENKGIKITLDEATRECAGSPNIPNTILEKIKKCDAFVCDITTINKSAPEDIRRTPNPNVLFELGYAVAYIGWDRVIMLHNDEFGNLKDLPFDICTQRTSQYRISSENTKNKLYLNNLVEIITKAISVIVLQQPGKPFLVSLQNSDEIKRRRDIDSIKSIMSTIHIPTLEKMVNDLPKFFDTEVFFYWASFSEVMESHMFHVYDEEIGKLFFSIYKLWRNCISHGDHYDVVEDRCIFFNPGDMPLNNEQEKAWNTIESARANFRNVLSKILKVINNRFLEIDIKETSNIAYRKTGICSRSLATK